jgi:hypothetical protein
VPTTLNPLPVGILLLAPKRKLPPLIVVLPVYVFDPFTIKIPAPDFTKSPPRNNPLTCPSFTPEPDPLLTIVFPLLIVIVPLLPYPPLPLYPLKVTISELIVTPPAPVILTVPPLLFTDASEELFEPPLVLIELPTFT